MTHPQLLTTPGVRVVRTSNDMEGVLDRCAGGPFQAAGLIGTNGNIGGAGVSGTLYFSLLGREIDANGSGWAGFNLWQTSPDREQFGIGNPGGPNYYGIYHNDTGEPAISDPAVTVDGNTHFFVGKVVYNADSQDFHTAWQDDPDPSLPEAAQPANIMRSAGSRAGQHNDGFDVYRMRGDNATGHWEFDEVRFGTTWESVTPVPEPTSGLLALLGIATLTHLRRRRRR